MIRQTSFGTKAICTETTTIGFSNERDWAQLKTRKSREFIAKEKGGVSG